MYTHTLLALSWLVYNCATYFVYSRSFAWLVMLTEEGGGWRGMTAAAAAMRMMTRTVRVRRCNVHAEANPQFEELESLK
jgi:hypothetical protein